MTQRRRMVELRIRMTLDEATAITAELNWIRDNAGLVGYGKLRDLHEAIAGIVERAERKKPRLRSSHRPGPTP